MYIDLMKRIKNYAFWVSLFAYGALFIQLTKLNVDMGQYDLAVKIILGLLGLFGIINNPTTDNKGFSDDK